jgi:hypothetical protein
LDGVGKLVDVRRFTVALNIGGSEAELALSRAGLVGELVPLEVTISIGQNGSAKVSEVVEGVLGEAFPHHAVRVALLAGATTPLDVQAFRRKIPGRENEVSAAV